MQIKLEVPEFIVKQVLDFASVADRLRPLVEGKVQEGHASTLIEADVVRLRRLAAEGKLNVREAAAFYQVGVETVRRAVRGDTWAHLGGVGKTQAQLDLEAKASLAKFLEMQRVERERLARPQEVMKGLDDVGSDGEERKPGDAGY